MEEEWDYAKVFERTREEEVAVRRCFECGKKCVECYWMSMKGGRKGIEEHYLALPQGSLN